MRPIQVYDRRNWAVIGLMTAVAIALNLGWIPLSPVMRGGINFAIGTALIISSSAYVSQPMHVSARRRRRCVLSELPREPREGAVVPPDARPGPGRGAA